MQAVPNTSTSTAKSSSITQLNAVKTKTPSKVIKSHPLAQQHVAASPIHSPLVTAAVGSNDDPKKHEIEEISKKISEHADAIYHTWKSRGLAPTELLEFYAHAAAAETGGAADFFAVATDSTAEGLQKLVNTFVIKDKEQRAAGIKANGKPATTTIKSATGAIDLSGPQQSIMTGGKLKQSGATKSSGGTQQKGKITTSSAILLKPGEGSREGADVVDTLKKKITKTSAATAITAGAKLASQTATTTTTAATAGATSSKTATAATIGKSLAGELKSNVKLTVDVQQQQQKHTIANTRSKSPTTTTNTEATATKTRITALNKTRAPTVGGSPLTLDINLNLDVNDLSELQTHNLRKIKELLHENANTSPVVTSNNSHSSSSSISTAKTAMTAAGSIKVKKPQTHAKLESAATTAVGGGGGGAANATTLVTNHSPKSRTIELTANKAHNSKTLGGAESGSGEDDKNSKSGGGISVGVVGGKRSGGAIKVSTTKLSSTTAGEQQQQKQQEQSQSQLQQAPQTAAQQQPKQTLSISGGSVSKAKDCSSEKITTRIASNHSDSNGTAKSLKAALKEDNNNNHNSHKAPSRKDTKAAISTAAAATATATVAAVGDTSGSEQSMEVGRSGMPAAPTKFVKPSRPLVNGQDKNVGRPILTRGSVAERVMMFEKCPDVRNSFLNIKRPDPQDAPPKSLLKVKLHATPPPPPEQNSIQKEFRNTKSVYIPRFYFPHGKPQPTIALERTLRGILGAFDSFPNNQVTKDELPRILKLCGLPFYWRMPVMIFCQQGNSGLVERQRFVEFWKQMNVYCHEAASRFVYILSRGQRFRSYIMPEDLAPLVQDVVDTHPGLAFLKEATEFHSRYVHTVIARIFYAVNRSWSGKITISELKKSDLLEVISLLEEEDDINQIMAFFSYEHFYVIYCKFWELDKDHDLLINQEDLARHSDHALSTRIVERIFTGCVTRSDNKKNPDDEPKMSYTDFVWFLLSEEDKRTPTAIEYWFRCMDIDGDGVLSMYELEYFYEEQQQRMESIGIETLPFEDCLCQMLDMIKPARRDCITLGDLKRCRMTHVFFDTFFNLEKYLDHEQRDPFASQRDEYASDWDRFAAQEYELLISEENE